MKVKIVTVNVSVLLMENNTRSTMWRTSLQKMDLESRN